MRNSESKLMDELIEKVVFKIIDYTGLPIGNGVHLCPKCGRNGLKFKAWNCIKGEFIIYRHKKTRGFQDKIIDFCEIR